MKKTLIPETRKHISETEKRILKRDFLAPFDWQVFVTFRLPARKVNINTTERMLKEWRRKLRMNHSRLKLAYRGVINHKPASHIHLVLAGFFEHNGRYKAIKPKTLEKCWPAGNASTKPIYDQAGVFGYIVDHNISGKPCDWISPVQDHGIDRIALAMSLGFAKVLTGTAKAA